MAMKIYQDLEKNEVQRRTSVVLFDKGNYGNLVYD